MNANLSPCKGKALKSQAINKSFALTGRLVDCHYTQGDTPAKDCWAFSPFQPYSSTSFYKYCFGQAHINQQRSSHKHATMNYKETVEYLFNSTPVFEHVGATAYKDGLDNSHALDAHFGHPHTRYQTIHVAGTNGKGSSSHTLASILQADGHRGGPLHKSSPRGLPRAHPRQRRDDARGVCGRFRAGGA